MVFSPVLLFLQFCVSECIGYGIRLSPTRSRVGEVSERLNEPVSKTGVLFIEYRGFESHPLRHSFIHLKVNKRMARSRPPLRGEADPLFYKSTTGRRRLREIINRVSIDVNH
jgi:hypothetical protein